MNGRAVPVADLCNGHNEKGNGMKVLGLTLIAAVLMSSGVASAKGGQGNVSVFAIGSCTAGVWQLSGTVTSAIRSDVPVDVYLDGALIGQPTLVQGVAWPFTATPAGRRSTVDVFLRGGVQELGRFQADSVCTR